MNTAFTASKTAFDLLRGFGRRPPPKERCELCGLEIAGEHPHVLRRSTGQILCACQACGILFHHRQEESRDLVRIPRRSIKLPDFSINDQDWAPLRLPIELAFFIYRSANGRVAAYYPSPAGSTESLLSLDAWEQIRHANPSLGQMQPDVEALLVDRTRGHRRYFLAPIDQCYRLTGLIRLHWRGFSGGDQVWSEVDRFFASLEESHGA